MEQRLENCSTYFSKISSVVSWPVYILIKINIITNAMYLINSAGYFVRMGWGKSNSVSIFYCGP
jgi:hypothetical protein